MQPQVIDPKTLGKVAVLMGGRSAERDISLMSGTGVLAAPQVAPIGRGGFHPQLELDAELRHHHPAQPGQLVRAVLLEKGPEARMHSAIDVGGQGRRPAFRKRGVDLLLLGRHLRHELRIRRRGGRRAFRQRIGGIAT